jgi:membrane fusion protein, multidrug efflux system
VPKGTCRAAIEPSVPRILFLAFLMLLIPAAHAAKPVIVAEARIERFEDRVEALGTLRANESIIISSTITETVSAIHFDDGDRVKAGQLLIEMASAEERALLEEARVTVAEAKRQFERVQALHAQRQAPLSLLDERQREWEAAQARVKAIEARLADRMIRAPFDGVLGLRNVSLGALVEPNDVITTLDDISSMKLEFPVPSRFLGVLRTGLDVVATSEAFPGVEFKGHVSAIETRIDPVTRSVMVRALLPNADGLLRPGLLMNLQLSRDVRNNIVMPEEVLIPLGRQNFVLVVDEANDNTVVRREVTIGSRRAGQVEILDGLRPGEKVIAHGATRVSPGEKVSIAAVDDGTMPLRQLLERMP